MQLHNEESRTLELRPDDRRNGHAPQHPELAKRIWIAVASYQNGVSYATQEKRFEESGQDIDPSWFVVADKLASAVKEAVSERLLSIFG